MNKFIKYLIIFGVIGILGVVFYNKVYIPKTTFKVISPKIGDLKESIRGIGNVNAKDTYLITAQTGGRILAINTDEGQWVKKGDLLVVMDGVDLPQQLEVAKATFQKAKYDIKASQDELVSQEVQKNLLSLTYDRYVKLQEQKFVSQAEYDKAKVDLESITATINATKSRINSSKSAAKIAEKNIDVIKEKISRLKVYSPVDGYVIEKSAEVAQNVLPSSSILKVIDTKTLWAETKIDERISSAIKKGQSGSIRLRSQADKSYEGIVKRVGTMSDAVTLEREIDVAFVNIPTPFYINEQAEVSIDINMYTNVLKIPLEVIVQNGGKLGVWVVDNNHAIFKAIDKIAQDDKSVAVKNLSKDMKIIVPNRNKKPLKDGMKIHQ
ncbi:MAG: efflux RND transporter periplasmic adaptor subunit [Sulfurimonas sp.]|nr:efflux RND transporter periplasmic adaptor subunit [Sulfurimonas sp.]